MASTHKNQIKPNPNNEDLSPDQTLGLVSLSLMQKLSQKDPSLSWLIEENKDLPINSNLGDKVSDFVGLFEYKHNNNLKFNYDFSLKNNLDDKNYELFGFEYYLNKFSSKFEYLNKNNSNLKTSYLMNETKLNFDEKNSLIFQTSENKEKSFTEYYNLIYQYENDCLKAGIEFNKEYYSDEDLKPSENLFFKITILPFGGFNTPNLK